MLSLTIGIVLKVHRTIIVVVTNSVRVHDVVHIEWTTIHEFETFPITCTAREMTHLILRGVISETKVLVVLTGSKLHTNDTNLLKTVTPFCQVNRAWATCDPRY